MGSKSSVFYRPPLYHSHQFEFSDIDETEVRGVQTRNLIVVGSAKAGKTWLVKNLIRRLGIRENIGNDKGLDITTGCDLYLTGQVQRTLGGRTYQFGFVDTEGFHRPVRMKLPDSAAIDPHGSSLGRSEALLMATQQSDPERDGLRVWSYVYSIPGVIVYVTSPELSDRDLLMLRILTAMVSLDGNRKFIVLHNRPSVDYRRLPEHEEELMRTVDLTVRRDSSGILRSTINGHELQHFFIFRSRDVNLIYNERVWDYLLEEMEHAPAASIFNCKERAVEKFDRMARDGQFEFFLNFCSEDDRNRRYGIKLLLRPISLTELRVSSASPLLVEHLEPLLGAPELVGSAQRQEQFLSRHFRLLELTGDVNPNGIEFSGMADPHQPFLCRLRCHSNHNHLGGEVPLGSVLWLPQVVLQVLGGRWNGHEGKHQILLRILPA